MPVLRALTLTGLCALFALTGAHADTLEMKNGDRLTGTIVSKADGTLTLQTDYAGAIKLNWADVQQVISAEPVKVILSDDTQLTGTLLPTEAGKVRIKSGEILETAPIDLAQVRYINPPVEVTGGVKFKGRVNVGVNVTSGNTETEQYHLDTELIARTLENRFTVGAIFNRATDDGTETESNATGYGKYDHFLTEKWYLSANSLFTRDEFKDLKLRTSIGLGTGYQFYETDQTTLSVEGGLNYVNEDYFTKADESFPAGRWAIDYTQLLFGTPIQFFHFQEGLLGLEDTEDIFIRTQTGLRLPLAEGMTATAQVDVDWDNQPAPGTETTDTRYLLNIGYGW